MNFHSLSQCLEVASAWAWKTSIAALILVVLVFVLQFALRKWLPPAARYALGLLIVARLAFPFAPESHFSIFNLGKLAPRRQPAAKLPVAYVEPPAASYVIAVSEAEFPTHPAPLSKLRLADLVSYAWAAGCLGLLAVAVVRYWRLRRRMNGWQPVTDPRVVSLLEECRQIAGVRQPVTLLLSSSLATPALLGSAKPRLLISEAILDRLEIRELRLVFLHELAHLKRGDPIINWLMILLRAVHWFNPVVWLAFKRLRADQELACDAAVMSLLGETDRRLYGETLIKMLETFSGTGLCPGLVPFITNKHTIKRRVTMIANYQPMRRFSAVVSLAAAAALSVATFTGAAHDGGATASQDQPGPATFTGILTKPQFQVAIQALEQRDGTDLLTASDAAQRQDTGAQLRDTLQAIQEQLKALREEVRQKDATASTQVDEVRKQLSELERKVGATVPAGNSDSTLNLLEEKRAQAQTALVEAQAKLDPLSPDLEVKNARIADLNRRIAEAKDIKSLEDRLAQLNALYKPEYPSIKSLTAIIEQERRDIATENALEDRLNQLEVTRAELSAHYTTDYPALRQIVAQMEEVKREIADQKARLSELQDRGSAFRGSPPLRFVLASVSTLTVAIASDGTWNVAEVTYEKNTNGPARIFVDRADSPELITTIERLKARLEAAREKNPAVSLYIKADSNAPIGQISKILEAAEEAGVHKVSFAAPGSIPK